MIYSIIQKLQLGYPDRIDAEYYKPEYLNLYQKLANIKSETLKNVASINGGKRLPVGDTFSVEGIPYVRIVDIFNTFIDIDRVQLISKQLHQILKRYQIQNKDILLTIVGNTVGLIGYNQLDLNKINFTENCARIRATKLIPEYLLAVLLSKVGQLQVTREKVGTAQPKLSLDRVRKFLIPVASEEFQKIIKSLIERSLTCLNDSKLFYNQTQQLLLHELGLEDFKSDNSLWSVVNFEEVKEANRIDADYFQQKYKDLISKINTRNPKFLGDLVSLQKGFEPGSEAYQEEGKTFIRVSSLSKFGINSQDQKYLSDDLYQKLKYNYEPKEGEILLTKDASPGTAYFITEPMEGIISGGILRLKIKSEVDGEYLTLCLNSLIGRMQAERDAGGSIIVHWKPDQIRNILIPILPIETQQKIADLVKLSHKARKKSKELLEEAKRKVEEMIEK